MGKTIMWVSEHRGNVAFRFTPVGGGARGWQALVDGACEIAVNVCEALGEELARPEGEKSLGRGASLVLSRRAYLKLCDRYRRQRHVAAALATGALEIRESAKLTARVVKRTGRLEAKRRARIEAKRIAKKTAEASELEGE